MNQQFPFDLEVAQFATLMYGILDVPSGSFRYVSAAHPGPIHVPVDQPPSLLVSPGFPIGLAEEPYNESVLQLAPGDRLYLYSDGLPEAAKVGGERFGDDRLLRALDGARAKPLQQGIAELLEAVEQWQGGESPQDDISILAVELTRGTPDAGSENSVK